MKKLISFLLIVLCGYWLYGRCSRSETDSKVLKQVKVAVKTANLRTGPGTNYDYVMLSDSTDKRQVSHGTVLDVVAMNNGWYEVRIEGEDSTAFIKQSLCVDLKQPKANKSSKGNSRAGSAGNAPSPSHSSSSQEAQPSQSTSQPPANTIDEVVEEVQGGQEQDDVIF